MRSTINKLNHILTRKEKRQLLVLFLGIVVNAFVQALGVASVMPFITLILDPNLIFKEGYEWLGTAYNAFNFPNIQYFTIAVGVAMLSVIILSNALSAMVQWMRIRFAWMNNHRLSLRLLEKYLSMPYPYFLNRNSADLSKNVLGEVKHLTNSFMLPLLMLITRAIMIIFILALLLWVDIIMSLLALTLLGGAYAAIYLSINKKLKKRGALRLRANKMRYKSVSEAFGGIKELKVMHREPYFLKMFSKASKETVRHLSWNAVVGEIPSFALEAIAFGGVTLFLLILLITRQEVQQVVPLVALFTMAGYKLMPAFQQIFHSIAQMQFNQAVLTRIYHDICNAKKPDSDIPVFEKVQVQRLPFKEEIRLNKVTYYYPGTSTPVIPDLDLVIKRNTSVALVGATGAGKTTIADIILGLLTPQKGTLTIDGVPVNEANLHSWQLNLGYVPQFIYLRDDTVASNIAFGLSEKEIDWDTLVYVSKIANLYDFIVNELPKGFDTVIGERGIRLSGGQRQRIGIARALYHNPEVIVFDEATSALDGITEDAVLKAMDNAARLKTLIIIAHRLTTVKNCDVIYLLEKGRIIASGTYDYLLQTNKLFRSMAKINA